MRDLMAGRRTSSSLRLSIWCTCCNAFLAKRRDICEMWGRDSPPKGVLLAQAGLLAAQQGLEDSAEALVRLLPA
jgi:hypothetical protein